MRNRHNKSLVILGTGALISRATASLILAEDWVKQNKCFELKAELADMAKALSSIRENSVQFKNFLQKALATQQFFEEHKGDCKKHEPKIQALLQEIKLLEFKPVFKKAVKKRKELMEA